MSTERTIHAEHYAYQPSRRRQFSLGDLFAIVTLAAILFAMAAPFLRAMQPEDVTRLVAVAGVQIAIIAGAIAVAATKHGKLLESSGQRIGVAYCGEGRWLHWPLVKSWTAILSLSAAQLFLALMYAAAPTDDMLSFWMFRLQLGLFAGFAFSRYLWRAHPGMIEFFENGVSVGGMKFYRWAQVDVRNSQLYDDRIVVVLRPTIGSVVADTRMARVSDAMRERLFATAAAADRKTRWIAGGQNGAA